MHNVLIYQLEPFTVIVRYFICRENSFCRCECDIDINTERKKYGHIQI